MSLVKSICAFAFITTIIVFEFNRAMHSPIGHDLSACCAGYAQSPKSNLGQQLRVCCLTQMKINHMDYDGDV